MDGADLSERSRQALQRFSAAGPTSERTSALTDLLNEKALNKVVKLPAFKVGVDALVAVAETFDPVERLRAVTQLARIGQAARGVAKDMERVTKPVLEMTSRRVTPEGCR